MAQQQEAGDFLQKHPDISHRKIANVIFFVIET
jgi:hypothetical protein